MEKCAHCLAVAEEDKQLKNFLTWFRTTKNPCISLRLFTMERTSMLGIRSPLRESMVMRCTYRWIKRQTEFLCLIFVMQMLQNFKMSTAMLKQLQTSPMTTLSMKWQWVEQTVLVIWHFFPSALHNYFNQGSRWPFSSFFYTCYMYKSKSNGYITAGWCTRQHSFLLICKQCWQMSGQPHISVPTRAL